MVLRLLDGFKDILAQPLAANSAVVPLNIGVLLGFPWLDVFKPNTLFICPFHQCSADVFWASVDTNGLRFAAPFDDLVQAADDTYSMQ